MPHNMAPRTDICTEPICCVKKAGSLMPCAVRHAMRARPGWAAGSVVTLIPMVPFHMFSCTKIAAGTANLCARGVG